MSNITILIDSRNAAERRSFKIAARRETTVYHLIFKLRIFIKIKPQESIFCFFQYPGLTTKALGSGWKKEKSYVGDKLLMDIQLDLNMEILECKVVLESTFGALSRMFVKARIEQRQSVFCVIITWSYYGLYHYDELSVHNSLHDATEHLLTVRCNGCLSLARNE